MLDTELLDLMIEHFQCEGDSLQEAKDLNETLNQLEALKSATEAFGLSRSLLAFADHDGNLSSAIPEIPSLESYLKDENVDLTIATEGVVEKIKTAAKRFMDAFLAHVTKFRSWYEKATVVLGGLLLVGTGGAKIALMAYYTAQLTGVVSITALAVPAIVVPVITAAVAVAVIKSIRSVPLAIKESLALDLPTDVDERISYMKKVARIFKARAGLDVTSLKLITTSSAEKGKTARELGYTKEMLGEVVHNVSDAVEELKRCDFIVQRLEALSRTVEASTSNGRAALMFLSDLITRVMNLAVRDTAKTITSAKHVIASIEDAIEEEKKNKD